MEETSFENAVFGRRIPYVPKIVDRMIWSIKSCKYCDERNVRLEYLIFRMMHKVVVKNIQNYQNLMCNSRRTEILPERDDLISDCYLLLNKSIANFKAGRGYDFYFYFNKVLSRHFFRLYQKALQSTELEYECGDALQMVAPSLREDKEPYDIDFVIESCKLTEMERIVCDCKLSGITYKEFLANHPEISFATLNKTIASLKKKLQILKR